VLEIKHNSSVRVGKLCLGGRGNNSSVFSCGFNKEEKWLLVVSTDIQRPNHLIKALNSDFFSAHEGWGQTSLPSLVKVVGFVGKITALSFHPKLFKLQIGNLKKVEVILRRFRGFHDNAVVIDSAIK